MKQDNELGLRISAKYNRIYIHRTTLKAMGDALRVRCWEDNSFCIQSKVLLDGICTVAPQVGTQDSCLLHGRLLKEQNAAAFDMSDIETITEAE